MKNKDSSIISYDRLHIWFCLKHIHFTAMGGSCMQTQMSQKKLKHLTITKNKDSSIISYDRLHIRICLKHIHFTAMGGSCT